MSKLLINHKTGMFSRLWQLKNASVGPFYQPKWQISHPSHILQQVKFHPSWVHLKWLEINKPPGSLIGSNSMLYICLMSEVTSSSVMSIKVHFCWRSGVVVVCLFLFFHDFCLFVCLSFIPTAHPLSEVHEFLWHTYFSLLGMISHAWVWLDMIKHS